MLMQASSQKSEMPESAHARTRSLSSINLNPFLFWHSGIAELRVLHCVDLCGRGHPGLQLWCRYLGGLVHQEEPLPYHLVRWPLCVR